MTAVSKSFRSAPKTFGKPKINCDNTTRTSPEAIYPKKSYGSNGSSFIFVGLVQIDPFSDVHEQIKPVDDIRFLFTYSITMFNPDAYLRRPNRSLIYFGVCIIAGLRLAREKHANIRVT